MWYTISLIIGLILLITGIYFVKERMDFLEKSSIAIGTVTELRQWENSEGTRLSKPIFKFKPGSKQEVLYEHNFSSNPPAWKVGDKANIAYDSTDPRKAKLLTYFGTFDVAIILIAAALPLIFIGVGYYCTQYIFRSMTN